jgi:hypothetical protein
MTRGLAAPALLLALAACADDPTPAPPGEIAPAITDDAPAPHHATPARTPHRIDQLLDDIDAALGRARHALDENR